MRTQKILEVDDGGLTFLFSAERPCSTVSLRFICLALYLSVTAVKLLHCFLFMRSRIGISYRRVIIVIGFL